MERTLEEIAESRLTGFSTSLDRNKPDEKELFILASQAADFPVADLLGKWIPCQHTLFQQCELTNRETGEIEHATRTVIISHDGVTVDCWSDGIVLGFQLLKREFGSPPYPPGFEVSVVEKRAGKKNRKYILNARMNLLSDLIPKK